MKYLLFSLTFLIACSDRNQSSYQSVPIKEPVPSPFEMSVDQVSFKKVYFEGKSYYEIRSSGSVKNLTGYNLTDYTIRVKALYWMHNGERVQGYDIRGPLRFDSDNGFGLSLFVQKSKWLNGEQKVFKVNSILMNTGIKDYPVRNVFAQYIIEAKDLLSYEFKDEVESKNLTNQWEDVIK